MKGNELVEIEEVVYLTQFEFKIKNARVRYHIETKITLLQVKMLNYTSIGLRLTNKM